MVRALPLPIQGPVLEAGVPFNPGLIDRDSRHQVLHGLGKLLPGVIKEDPVQHGQFSGDLLRLDILDHDRDQALVVFVGVVDLQPADLRCQRGRR